MKRSRKGKGRKRAYKLNGNVTIKEGKEGTMLRNEERNEKEVQEYKLKKGGRGKDR